MSFKLRSLPNIKTYKRYLNAFMLLFAIFFTYNFIYIMLVADDFTPDFPPLFLISLPIVFFGVYSRIESNYKKVDNYDMRKIIFLIRLKQLQPLIDELNEKPEVINYKYRNKSLIYWAKHYNNVKAHTLIAKLISESKAN